MLFAVMATFTCASTNATAAPPNLSPSLAVSTGTSVPVFTVKSPDRTVVQTTLPNVGDYHSAVSLRLAAAANRNVTKASSLPDSESPQTLNRKAIPGVPEVFDVAPGILEAKLSWSAPAVKGFGVNYYLLTYQPGDGGVVLDAATLTTTIKNLTGDTEYAFSLRTSNEFGDSAPAIKRATVQAPPPPPPPPPVYYAQQPAQPSNSHLIGGVTFHYQAHNLSCEEANTSMALSHQGIYVDENQILAGLGVDNTPAVVVNGQLVSWGDPDKAFVGNVNGLERNRTGYQANPKALMRVISSYGGRVIEWGEPGVAGYISPQEIYAQVLADHPVVAYATYDWAWHPRHDYRSEDGNMVAWIGPYDAHVYTVVGVSPGAVLVNDPIRGQYWVSKGSFEAAYSDFNMAIVFA